MGLRNRHLYNDYNIFFITTTCYKWLHLLSVGNNMELVQNSLNFCCAKFQASILGYVIMPNHLHLIIHFELGKNRIDFMRDFKKFTSVQIRNEVQGLNPSIFQKISYNKGKQKFKVWQDRFDELFLESQNLLEDKLEYIHQNPLQEHWSLAENPEDYRFSSARFYLSSETLADLPLVDYIDFFV